MSDTTGQEAFKTWFQSLTVEQLYDFDSEGRGYKKGCGHMMRLAFDAGRAITAPQAQEPEQPAEPVAPKLLDAITVRNSCSRGYNRCGFDSVAGKCVAEGCAPKAQEPLTLTDEQIRNVVINTRLCDCIDDAYYERGDWFPIVREFAIAVLAAAQEQTP